MTDVNSIQHGGSHYKGAKMQHWDFVVGFKLGYLEGCASKYLTRHKQKNGLEDILKAEHYVMKILQVHEDFRYQNTSICTLEEAWNFCEGAGMDGDSTAAFNRLCTWKYSTDLLKIIPMVRILKRQYQTK